MKEQIKTIDPETSGEALEQIINMGATVPIVVTGSSMMPFLRDGVDTVWLAKQSRYRRGQILFFRRVSGEYILHRIRRIFPDGRILVNGDAQAWCEMVPPDGALAAVTAVTRKGITRPTGKLSWKIRDALWYPTRPIRPKLFTLYEKIKRLTHK